MAISIPIFTSQLEKSRIATDEANCRSAYGEATATYLGDADKASHAITGSVTVGKSTYTWTMNEDANEMTVSTSAGTLSSKYSGGISYDGKNFS